MSDLIDRQTAIDALKYAQHSFTVADEAGGMGTVKWIEDFIYFAAAERVLTDLPSAPPEIIRCKDCKYRFVDGENVRFNVCELNHNKVQSDDWFCADGERRIDG